MPYACVHGPWGKDTDEEYVLGQDHLSDSPNGDEEWVKWVDVAPGANNSANPLPIFCYYSQFDYEDFRDAVQKRNARLKGQSAAAGADKESVREIIIADDVEEGMENNTFLMV